MASAGHPPPVLIRRGSARLLTGPSLLLGYVEDTTYERRREALEPGDSIVFYTDGVTDAQAPRRQLEPEDIADLAASWESSRQGAGGASRERGEPERSGRAGRHRHRRGADHGRTGCALKLRSIRATVPRPGTGLARAFRKITAE